MTGGETVTAAHPRRAESATLCRDVRARVERGLVMMAGAMERRTRGAGAATLAACSDLRLTGFPIRSLDTSEETSCGFLGRLRVGESLLLRLEGVGLVRAAAVTIEVSGGVAAVERLSLYDYTVSGVALGDGVPFGRVVFLDGSVAYVPFTSHVPFVERRADMDGLAIVGVIRVEGD